ncbi:rho GTPase-activating protein 18-like isoform X1 [Limulus polyphemus]|uniref:Rho GTPase-activating protein 18-like isoform X1 n=1 Tax=Limulus polyphemus TaxID=6850 RepID=A0ABM1SG73_LIMPO|nr:rho GTPase-activating protein 18-like isoform X1 [Limulus polyphemus]
METVNSQEFEDYWNEFRVLEEIIQNYDSDEFYDTSKPPEEGENEADWLRDAGFDVESLLEEDGQDKEKQLEEHLATLTHHQVEAVKKRFLTCKNTICRRQSHEHIPDVRDVFSHIPLEERTDPQAVSNALTNSSSPISTNGVCEDFSSDFEESVTVFRAPNNSYQFQEVPGIQEKYPKPQRKDKNFLRSGHKQYQLTPSEDLKSKSTTDIEGLRYQMRRSVREPSHPASSGNTWDVLEWTATGNDNQVDTNPYSEAVGTRRLVDKEKGFSELQCSEELPEVERPEEKLGITYPTYLGKEDLAKIRNLALIELTSLFDAFGLSYNRRKPLKRKLKESTNTIFGVPLTTLLEHDIQKYASCRVPLVFQRILFFLEKQGLKEVGLLRISSSKHKVEILKKEIEASFYSAPHQVENVLKNCSPHDVASVMKHFIRDLPEPLLTNKYMNAFLHIHDIHDPFKQLRALNMLVMLLPDVHRETLLALVTFLAQLAAEEEHNQMNLRNIAMIMAPNLFPPSSQRNSIKTDIDAELNMATKKCRATEMLIKYRDILWTVPSYLLQQVRQKNEYEVLRKADGKVKKILGKKSRADMYKIVEHEQGNPDKAEITVNAWQFTSQPVLISVSECTMVSDVLHQVAKLLGINFHPQDLANKGRSSRRSVPDIVPVLKPSQKCLQLTTDVDTFLQTHSLHEVGGNIGERRLEDEANALAVHLANPTAVWELRCCHW